VEPAVAVEDAGMQLYADVARQYEDFAGYARGESPCFEGWASHVVHDEEVQVWIASLPPAKQQPNLVFAAARWHGVPAPGPYDDLRAALLSDEGTIRSTILSRSTQTNEVGRLATLAPVFSHVQEVADRPLALVEAGASAGLCLYPDRFAYEWRTSGGRTRVTPDQSPADPPPEVLTCDVEGDAPLPSRPPWVSWRGGLDLNPLDVNDDAAMAWLVNLVWPEQEDRRHRLEAALAVARAEPVPLVRGDLLHDLPPLIEEASSHGEVVVFHSAVIAYLEETDRGVFQRMMGDLVADGACHWVSNEAPEVLPEVTATAPGAPAGRFVMALDGRAVAWTHGHGRSMTWH
jgi:hypothetical protein